MILADKLLNLRKKAGLSQEELAEKLQVSRQSVSKWESAASVPDINKIIALSKFFGVSTDYLLKEDLEMEEYSGEEEKSDTVFVTIEEANAFLETSKHSAKKIAVGVTLCILSPTLLIFLEYLAEEKNLLTTNAANALGMTWLFLFIAVAVVLFIHSDGMTKPYDYLKEDFQLSFGVSGIIGERQAAFLPYRTKKVAFSVTLFILGALPLILFGIEEESETAYMPGLMLLFLAVAIGVHNLILCETEKESYEKLLSQGEFRRRCDMGKKKEERIESIFWPIVTAIYLGWSFLTHDWGITWVIWPVAALLYQAIAAFFLKD